MRAILFASLLAVASPLAASTASEPVELETLLTTHVEARVEIDRAGRLVAYQSDTPLPAELAARVDAMARELRFEPVEVDGRIVHAVASMRLTLAAREREDGAMEVRIDHVAFPVDQATPAVGALPRAVRLVPRSDDGARVALRFPREALRIGANGKVLLAVRVGLDGRVEDVSVRQGMLVHPSVQGRPAQTALEAFERAATTAIRSWRFDVELPPGHTPTPDDLTGLVPVEFVIHGNGLQPERAGSWRRVVRGPLRPTPWLTRPEPFPTGVADIQGDRAPETDPRFRRSGVESGS